MMDGVQPVFNYRQYYFKSRGHFPLPASRAVARFRGYSSWSDCGALGHRQANPPREQMSAIVDTSLRLLATEPHAIKHLRHAPTTAIAGTSRASADP